MFQGYKELTEKCQSQKILSLEHKKNAEKIQNMRQKKIGGLLATSPDLIFGIENRIGNLHVDDINRRKTYSKDLLSEETHFVILFTGTFLSENTSKAYYISVF